MRTVNLERTLNALRGIAIISIITTAATLVIIGVAKLFGQ